MDVLRTMGSDVPGETRGRPRIKQDDEILAPALEAFAAQGYEAMSLRSLNTQLGLSHGTISQRFGSKERLYFAAVDLGFSRFLDDVARRRHDLLTASDPPDDLADLRATVRALLGASLLRPELGRLMNQEGLEPSGRLSHIVDAILLPLFVTIGELLDRLRSTGRIRPVTARGTVLPGEPRGGGALHPDRPVRGVRRDRRAPRPRASRRRHDRPDHPGGDADRRRLAGRCHRDIAPQRRAGAVARHPPPPWAGPPGRSDAALRCGEQRSRSEPT